MGTNDYYDGMRERGYYDSDATICLAHLDDGHLRTAAGDATATTCTFCGSDEPRSAPFAVAFDRVLDPFMRAVWSRYGGVEDALVIDGEAYGLVDRDEAIWYIGDGAFSSNVAERVLAHIGDTFVDTDVTEYPGTDSTDDLSFAWREFSESVRFVSRFVVPRDDEDRAPLARLNGFLRELTVYVDGQLGLVRDVPIGTSFFRGRLIKHPRGDIPRTADELGPAPSEKAAANRMSAAGISLFYASEDAETAVAEIALHGVEPFAVIGRFSNRDALRVLDLTTLPAPISPFDFDRQHESRMLAFLEEFVGEITRPIVPDSTLHIEYAPTQVLTEYLRWAPDSPLDGIALPSSQTGRRTYVLFLDAVAANQQPPGPPVSSGFLLSRFEFDPDVDTYEVKREVSARKLQQ